MIYGSFSKNCNLRTYGDKTDVVMVDGLLGTGVFWMNDGALDLVRGSGCGARVAYSGVDAEIAVRRLHDAVDAVSRGEDVTLAYNGTAAVVLVYGSEAEGNLVWNLIDIGVLAANDPRVFGQGPWKMTRQLRNGNLEKRYNEAAKKCYNYILTYQH